MHENLAAHQEKEGALRAYGAVLAQGGAEMTAAVDSIFQKVVGAKPTVQKQGDHTMSQKGTLYFFTGLAGAGKTTIGGLFYQRLLARDPEAVLRDGDRIRTAVGHSTADGTVVQGDRYTTEARKAGARIMFQDCRALTDTGRNVVVCSISMYQEIRAWNRENFEKYKEIYIKVTRETLYKRDQKKLYSSGTKNVVGVDLPYDEPEKPDIVVWNDGQETPEEIVDRLEKLLLEEG